MSNGHILRNERNALQPHITAFALAFASAHVVNQASTIQPGRQHKQDESVLNVIVFAAVVVI